MSARRTAVDAATRGYAVARALHAYVAPVWRLVPFVILVGCIIPPSLGLEQQDAGTNSPPSIISVRSDQTELPEPGPIGIAVGQMSPLNLTLLDTDINDTLYVRVFVDYSAQTNPTSPRSTCPAATSGQPQRTATCPMQGICLSSEVNDGKTHIMQVMVFDREPLETGAAPLFQAMPMGGLSTDRVYVLNCLPSS